MKAWVATASLTQSGDVAGAAYVVGAPAVHGLIAFRMSIDEELEVKPNGRMFEKADVEVDPPVGKPGVTGEGGEIDGWIVHRAVGVVGRLEAEDRVVELGRGLDVVDHDVQVRNRLNVGLRVEAGHDAPPRRHLTR
jgi:hypothetical protein